MLLDTDNNATTGCDVAVDDANINTTIQGVEQVVRIQVQNGTSPATVTAIVRNVCNAGTFGADQQVDPGDWNIGIDNGTNGADVVEGYVSRAALGNPSQMRVVFFSTVCSGFGCGGGGYSDTLMTTDGTNGGNPIVLNLQNAVAAVPTLPNWAILFLALSLAAVAYRVLRERVGMMVAAIVAIIVGVGSAGTAKAITATMDGQVDDWAGVTPVGTDALNDTSTSNDAEDIVAGFVSWDDQNFYLRVDVKDIPDCGGNCGGF